MLVTNSEFNFSGTEVKEEELRFTRVIVRVFQNAFKRMIKYGARHAVNHLASIELADCVAQCMDKGYRQAIQSAGLVETKSVRPVLMRGKKKFWQPV